MRSLARKVIYLSPVENSIKLSFDYKIYELREKGVNVEFWNIRNLIFEEDCDITVNYKFSSFCDLEEQLSRPEYIEAIFIVLVYFEWRSLKLYKLLTKYNLFMAYFYWGSTKIFSINSYIRNLIMRSPAEFLSKILKKLILIFYKKFRLIKPFDIVFLAEFSSLKKIDNCKKIQIINSADYERFHFLNKKYKKNDNYAVFLDVNLPFHQDNKIFKLSNIDPKKYYDSLNIFFDFIEKKFNIKIIVAAHPTMNRKNEIFFKRKVYYGKTPELAANSKFLISHHSLSINYAVLNYKPIFFIYTDDMNRNYKHSTVNYIKNLADYFHMPFINIDSFNDRDVKICRVNKDSYNNYKYSYLTSKHTEFKSNSEVFSDYLINYQIINKC